MAMGGIHYEIFSGNIKPKYEDRKLKIILSKSKKSSEGEGDLRGVRYMVYEYGNWQSVGIKWLRRRSSGATSVLTGEDMIAEILSSTHVYSVLK